MSPFRKDNLQRASIKYVLAEGEGGCQRNDQFLRTIVLIGCVKSVREGGRGSKIPKIWRTYSMDTPFDIMTGSANWNIKISLALLGAN